MQASLRTSRWSTLEKAHLTCLNAASDFLHDSQFKDKCLQPLIYKNITSTPNVRTEKQEANVSSESQFFFVSV